MLDLGAGSGRNPYELKGRVGRVVGVDLATDVLDNPLLDEAHVADLVDLPFDDGTFDVAFAVYVLEHIQAVDEFYGRGASSASARRFVRRAHAKPIPLRGPTCIHHAHSLPQVVQPNGEEDRLRTRSLPSTR